MKNKIAPDKKSGTGFPRFHPG